MTDPEEDQPLHSPTPTATDSNNTKGDDNGASLESKAEDSNAISTDTEAQTATLVEKTVRRKKKHPPPITPKLLKRSKVKYYIPPELVISDDDDDQASDEAAKLRLLDIFQGRGRTGILSNTENPVPSTSVALAREQLRIKRAARKQSLLKKKVNPRKSQKSILRSSHRIQPSRVVKSSEAPPASSLRKRKTEPQPSQQRKSKAEPKQGELPPKVKKRRKYETSPPLPAPSLVNENSQSQSTNQIVVNSLTIFSERVPIVQITDCQLQPPDRDSTVTNQSSESEPVASNNISSDAEPNIRVRRGRNRKSTSLRDQSKLKLVPKVEKATNDSKPRQRKLKSEAEQDSVADEDKNGLTTDLEVELRRSGRRRVPRKFDDGWVYLGLTSII